MKNNKLFKSLSSLALAGIMAFSSVSFVSAEETQVTDKPSFDMVYENEAGVKYLSEEDTKEVALAMYGSSILSLDKYATVHIVDDDTVFSVNWDNSTYKEEDVTGMYICTYLWYRDENGVLTYAKGYNAETEEPTEEDCFKLGVDFRLFENAKGELNIKDNFCYSDSDYIADGGDEKVLDESTWEDKSPLEYVGGTLLAHCKYYSLYIYDIIDGMNSKDTTEWSKPQSVFSGSLDARDLAYFYDNNMFLATVCIEYTNPETGKVNTVFDYIVSESALENENNPFRFLDEKPEEDIEDNDKDDETTVEKIKEVVLAENNKVISKDDMIALITENATKDVAIKTPAGITLTFGKGTMKAVDGKDKYDFGVSISNDYSKHSDMGTVTKDNFVSLIDFSYSGKLPAEASVKIPVGVERAGQTLYYSQKVEAGYTLVQSVKVDSEGYITVKQDHCSTYVVTTADVSKDSSSDVPVGPTETPNAGDSNYAKMYIVLFVVAAFALVIAISKKIEKRA